MPTLLLVALVATAAPPAPVPCMAMKPEPCIADAELLDGDDADGDGAGGDGAERERAEGRRADPQRAYGSASRRGRHVHA